MADPAEDPPGEPARSDAVTPLELFFDLVFVFALTQVTALLASDPSWTGLVHALLVLTAIWWSWAAYAWLTNEVDVDRTPVRLAIFGAMIAMLVVALAVPESFGDHAVLFGVAYLAMRLIHVVLFLQSSDDVEVVAASRALAPTAALAPLLLLGGAILGGPAQAVVWAVVLVVDLGAAGVRGIGGWHLSPGHFAERHGLIVIIALGESIVAIGVGAEGVALGTTEIVAAALGVVVAASMWWAYFDVVAVVAERKLHDAPAGRVRNVMARDSYSYLHLPMVAGIVLFALGAKKALEHVGEPLDAVPAFALCGGVATYLVAHVAFRRRNVGSFNPHRTAAAVACAALFPLALEADAVVSLACVAAVCAALIAYETVAFREARAAVRAGVGRPKA